MSVNASLISAVCSPPTVLVSLCATMLLVEVTVHLFLLLSRSYYCSCWYYLDSWDRLSTLSFEITELSYSHFCIAMTIDVITIAIVAARTANAATIVEITASMTTRGNQVAEWFHRVLSRTTLIWLYNNYFASFFLSCLLGKYVCKWVRWDSSQRIDFEGSNSAKEI